MFVKGQKPPRKPGQTEKAIATRSNYANRVARDTTAKLRAMLLMEAHCEEAAKTLIRLSKSKKDQIAYNAAMALLDRVMGKPTQAMELSGKDGKDLTPSVNVSIKSPSVSVELSTSQTIELPAQPENVAIPLDSIATSVNTESNGE